MGIRQDLENQGYQVNWNPSGVIRVTDPKTGKSTDLLPGSYYVDKNGTAQWYGDTAQQVQRALSGGSTQQQNQYLNNASNSISKSPTGTVTSSTPATVGNMTSNQYLASNWLLTTNNGLNNNNYQTLQTVGNVTTTVPQGINTINTVQPNDYKAAIALQLWGTTKQPVWVETPPGSSFTMGNGKGYWLNPDGTASSVNSVTMQTTPDDPEILVPTWNPYISKWINADGSITDIPQPNGSPYYIGSDPYGVGIQGYYNPNTDTLSTYDPITHLWGASNPRTNGYDPVQSFEDMFSPGGDYFIYAPDYTKRQYAMYNYLSNLPSSNTTIAIPPASNTVPAGTPTTTTDATTQTTPQAPTQLSTLGATLSLGVPLVSTIPTADDVYNLYKQYNNGQDNAQAQAFFASPDFQQVLQGNIPTWMLTDPGWAAFLQKLFQLYNPQADAHTLALFNKLLTSVQ